jgi:UDP-GlcNAc:undecaprenyl-phosphate GlcNAc-1-phosphate transferase
MKSLVAAVLVGYLASRLAWLAARPLFASSVLARHNYRGRSLPTAAGLVLPLAALVVEGGRAVAGSLGVGHVAGPGSDRALVLLAAFGFGLLGLVDDVAGGADHGFRGHLGALARGRLTTGALKLLGGGLLALVVVAPVAGASPGRLLADAALVALSANLANLLDRAPGRTVKAALAGFVVLAVAASRTAALSATAVAVGAALGLFLDDLHERLMLGDAGSNVLGAVLGLGVVVACGPPARNLVLAVVAALNLAGELVSFTRVIEAVAPLRALDRAGRRP